MDVGLVQVPRPGRSASMAQMAEENGFATLLFTDSQNLAPEVWSQLHLAAAATRHIALGPGVTNSQRASRARQATARSRRSRIEWTDSYWKLP
jgi:alkanesulfonate monooxygenase SsuD/methylene tetrahydromethanopterin reductase-like flavin-dependent oxidoreductase (luciferase family)